MQRGSLTRGVLTTTVLEDTQKLAATLRGAVAAPLQWHETLVAESFVGALLLAASVDQQASGALGPLFVHRCCRMLSTNPLGRPRRDAVVCGFRVWMSVI